MALFNDVALSVVPFASICTGVLDSLLMVAPDDTIPEAWMIDDLRRLRELQQPRTQPVYAPLFLSSPVSFSPAVNASALAAAIIPSFEKMIKDAAASEDEAVLKKGVEAFERYSEIASNDPNANLKQVAGEYIPEICRKLIAIALHKDEKDAALHFLIFRAKYLESFGENRERALESLQFARTLAMNVIREAREGVQPVKLLSFLTSLAHVEVLLDNYDEAEKNMTEVLGFLNPSQHLQNIVMMYRMLARAYMERRQYVRASELIFKSDFIQMQQLSKAAAEKGTLLVMLNAFSIFMEWMTIRERKKDAQDVAILNYEAGRVLYRLVSDLPHLPPSFLKLACGYFQKAEEMAAKIDSLEMHYFSQEVRRMQAETKLLAAVLYRERHLSTQTFSAATFANIQLTCAILLGEALAIFTELGDTQGAESVRAKTGSVTS
ncbi:MAG: hypothetical protein Q7T03_09365 [Deltaproteobacteria bacterium]|nr:hypothetical protein [Deltaproteobacteria bacterium]